jgi:hypothetical protein
MHINVIKRDVGGNRGRGGGGGYRDGGAGHFNNGGGRGFFPRGRGGRGRFFPPHGREQILRLQM